ncbi:Lon protease family protein [Nitrosovibrio sp. Nv6]|uniref:Lon protease family protein n=1 Tax=Nitrosovibrio sp. Nv6 TaxID=1855340 RepID=UPI0008D59B47|nr:ATP-binding protein [Nitrosovibrio sp. Nv6]SEP19833.1 lon-related putative ATP-dependent protease [Nitrosovibrio sp. Nv6]
MTTLSPLDHQLLRSPCDPDQLGFQTTADLEDLTEIIGQVRAMDAVHFGASIRHEGYNLFVLGPSGMGKKSSVQQFLEKKAHDEREPDDWCYINNFTQPHKPHALRMPSGRGEELRQHMEKLVDYLRSAIPALFESDEYRAKTAAIQAEFHKRQEDIFKGLGDDAEKQEVTLLRTPEGFAFAPTRNKEVIPPDEYEKLPEEERKRIETAIAELQERLEKILSHVPQWRRERSERVKELNREIALSAVEHMIDELRAIYADLPEVLKYLDAVQQDMVEHVDDFRKQEESANISGMTIVTRQTFHNYQVNVLATNGKKAGAPIISEDNPTYTNLIGRVEHIAQLGALVTDFTLIKPGALHRANGGYLLLDIRKVLVQPFAWEGLKRALQSREIHIESLGQMYSLISTVSLEPEPIPLDAKIVLFGDRLFYYLLQEYDPEFSELFKVAADFEERIERSADTLMMYARLISALTRKEALLPFDRSGVARVIEHSARLAGDAERLSIHMRSVADLLREADHWAREAGHEVVAAGDVQRAIDTQIRRQDRLKDRLHEEILRGTLMIDTEGAVAGQVNGLSVIVLGNFAFAQPTRITATTRFGDGELINIEREVKLSGAIHSKGILILSSFLAARYARNQPLALSASLVFEQSYGMVEGDSASMAELCALLSNLASAPINQAFAVTGSVNQLGQAQAIGAVNEKIEGFFDICAARGLNGEQGVLIPSTNVKHLMLRQDVVAAAKAGQFHIYPIENVDQAIGILTNLPAGEPGDSGEYPEGSLNQRVAARLNELTEISKSFLLQLEKKLGEEKNPD